MVVSQVEMSQYSAKGGSLQMQEGSDDAIIIFGIDRSGVL